MKVALVHDWLTGMRGGEKCLEVLCRIYPDADLFTLLHRPGSVSALIEDRPIHCSDLQRIPGIMRNYRYFLPLMPLAIESFDLNSYDLVISTSHCVAKGVLTDPETPHISYLHTPMRYAWDQWPQYARKLPSVTRWIASPILKSLRTWDVASSHRVDRFVANSHFVAQRIRSYYGRSSTVIHPPVRTGFFDAERKRGDHYLIVGAMVPYKCIDLAIETFNALEKPLLIVGEGSLLKKLLAQAGPTIRFTGRISDEELRSYYGSCRALVQMALEDFGIVCVEAQAAGCPVIALGRAGVLDSVVPLNGRLSRSSSDPPTGVFFYEQTPESLAEAIRLFEGHEEIFDPEQLRAHAEQFDESIFERRMRELIDETLRADNTAAWRDLETAAAG